MKHLESNDTLAPKDKTALWQRFRSIISDNWAACNDSYTDPSDLTIKLAISKHENLEDFVMKRWNLSLHWNHLLTDRLWLLTCKAGILSVLELASSFSIASKFSVLIFKVALVMSDSFCFVACFSCFLAVCKDDIVKDKDYAMKYKSNSHCTIQKKSWHNSKFRAFPAKLRTHSLFFSDKGTTDHTLV